MLYENLSYNYENSMNDELHIDFQSMDNLTPEEKLLPAAERVGLSMKLAGVSITVTSITNMFAFLIGATSVNKSRYDKKILILLKYQFHSFHSFKYVFFYFRACQSSDHSASFVGWGYFSCTFFRSHFLLRKN